MKLFTVRVDQYIVNKNKDKLISVLIKNFAHEIDERCWSIGLYVYHYYPRLYSSYEKDRP